MDVSIGSKIGWLEILGPPRIGRKGPGEWPCRCTLCGREKAVSNYLIRRNRAVSCGCVSRARRWSDEEKQILRKFYPKHGLKGVRKKLPGRHDIAIQQMAVTLDCLHMKMWTATEVAYLQLHWQEETTEQIAKALGRNEMAVRHKAKKMGLPFGVPQGHETIHAAATRCGMTVPAFKRAIRRYGVTIRTMPTGKVGPKATAMKIVVSHDVTDAIEKWCKTETVQAAARRLRINACHLRRLLLESGETPPRKRMGHWRVDSEVLDRVYKSYSESRSGKETLTEAAERVGVCRPSVIARWLAKAGVPRESRGKFGTWLVDPTTVDRVIAEHGHKPRQKRGTCHPVEVQHETREGRAA